MSREPHKNLNRIWLLLLPVIVCLGWLGVPLLEQHIAKRFYDSATTAAGSLTVDSVTMDLFAKTLTITGASSKDETLDMRVETFTFTFARLTDLFFSPKRLDASRITFSGVRIDLHGTTGPLHCKAGDIQLYDVALDVDAWQELWQQTSRENNADDLAIVGALLPRLKTTRIGSFTMTDVRLPLPGSASQTEGEISIAAVTLHNLNLEKTGKLSITGVNLTAQQAVHGSIEELAIDSITFPDIFTPDKIKRIQSGEKGLSLLAPAAIENARIRGAQLSFIDTPQALALQEIKWSFRVHENAVDYAMNVSKFSIPADLIAASFPLYKVFRNKPIELSASKAFTATGTAGDTLEIAMEPGLHIEETELGELKVSFTAEFPLIEAERFSPEQITIAKPFRIELRENGLLRLYDNILAAQHTGMTLGPLFDTAVKASEEIRLNALKQLDATVIPQRREELEKMKKFLQHGGSLKLTFIPNGPAALTGDWMLTCDTQVEYTPLAPQ